MENMAFKRDGKKFGPVHVAKRNFIGYASIEEITKSR